MKFYMYACRNTSAALFLRVLMTTGLNVARSDRKTLVTATMYTPRPHNEAYGFQHLMHTPCQRQKRVTIHHAPYLKVTSSTFMSRRWLVMEIPGRPRRESRV